MNAGLSYFPADVQTSVPVAMFSVQKTSAEIEELLRLKTSHPVKAPKRVSPKPLVDVTESQKKLIKDVSLKSSHPCDNG